MPKSNFFIFNILLALTLLITSCKTVSNVFRSTTPHEVYERKLRDADLQNTVMGSKWLEAAKFALAKPVRISLPYQERYYFAADGGRALSYRFDLLQGERIDISWQRVSAGQGKLFADLFEWNEGKPSLLTSADTISQQIQHTGRKATTYLLRLQPELLQSMEVTIQIKASSSLAFPVPLNAKPKTQSFWGADRDGGARRHEGIDIFAAHRTPVIAAAPGMVHRVGENNLGGKVVFVRTEAGSHYYAHLDEQLVTDGETVQTGDTLGLMGNTGNARGGASHLHFGIYTLGGAIDPYPFVRTDRPEPPKLSAPSELLNNYVSNTKFIRLRKTSDSTQINISPSTPLWVTGIEQTRLKVVLPVTNDEAWIDASQITGKQVSIKMKADVEVYEKPSMNSARIGMLKKGASIKVIGNTNGFVLIEKDNIVGWVIEHSIN